MFSVYVMALLSISSFSFFADTKIAKVANMSRTSRNIRDGGPLGPPQTHPKDESDEEYEYYDEYYDDDEDTNTQTAPVVDANTKKNAAPPGFGPPFPTLGPIPITTEALLSATIRPSTFPTLKVLLPTSSTPPTVAFKSSKSFGREAASTVSPSWTFRGPVPSPSPVSPTPPPLVNRDSNINSNLASIGFDVFDGPINFIAPDEPFQVGRNVIVFNTSSPFQLKFKGGLSKGSGELRQINNHFTWLQPRRPSSSPSSSPISNSILPEGPVLDRAKLPDAATSNSKGSSSSETTLQSPNRIQNLQVPLLQNAQPSGGNLPPAAQTISILLPATTTPSPKFFNFFPMSRVSVGQLPNGFRSSAGEGPPFKISISEDFNRFIIERGPGVTLPFLPLTTTQTPFVSTTTTTASTTTSTPLVQPILPWQPALHTTTLNPPHTFRLGRNFVHVTARPRPFFGTSPKTRRLTSTTTPRPLSRMTPSFRVILPVRVTVTDWPVKSAKASIDQVTGFLKENAPTVAPSIADVRSTVTPRSTTFRPSPRSFTEYRDMIRNHLEQCFQSLATKLSGTTLASWFQQNPVIDDILHAMEIAGINSVRGLGNMLERTFLASRSEGWKSSSGSSRPRKSNSRSESSGVADYDDDCNGESLQRVTIDKQRREQPDLKKPNRSLSSRSSSGGSEQEKSKSSTSKDSEKSSSSSSISASSEEKEPSEISNEVTNDEEEDYEYTEEPPSYQQYPGSAEVVRQSASKESTTEGSRVGIFVTNPEVGQRLNLPLNYLPVVTEFRRTKKRAYGRSSRQA